MSMRIIKIGIASQEKIRERVLAIAKGELKPKASDSKIWFISMESLTKTLIKQSKEAKK
jgi:predicted transcriptional regulator